MDLNVYLAKKDKTLQQHTDEVVNELKTLVKYGYLSDTRLIELTRLACNYHDYGKVNAEFQKRILSGKKFNEEIEVAHNVLSIFFINQNDFCCEDDYYKVACSVLFHHDYCDEEQTLREKSNLISSLLCDFQTEVYELKARKIKKIIESIEEYDVIKIKGLLHKCDYSASAGVPIEYPANYLLTSMNTMLERWANNNADIKWNDLQIYCKQHTDDNLMIIAPTGMGKTEAGLLWIGDRKGFFILPLKTAINAIYNRINENIILHEKVEERLGLLHSDTKALYAQNENDEMHFIDYYEKTKQLSMPLTISTVDQLFDFVFRFKGYEMKLVTLGYSKIVLDEIQMYNAKILAYIVYGISRIIEHGGKVAILTATLPPFVRDLMCEKAFNYNVIEEKFSNDMIRHSIKVIDAELDCDAIKEMYTSNKKDGKNNKILVVCNTLKKAQEVYRYLVEELGDDEINILHNKFIKKDRKRKEEEIFEFGKTENNHANGIWIATTIVEASLDIDFDYLFTELSDLNSLFQRLGRCNRKGKKDVNTYNCYVYTQINPIIISKDKGFIDKDMYELSKTALQNIDGILSENKKLELIDQYFTTAKMKHSKYVKEFENTFDKIENLSIGDLKKEEIDFRNILSYSIIPLPVYEKYKKEIIELREKIEEPNISIIQKTILVDKIKQFSLDIQPYQFKRCNIQFDIILNRHEKIPVLMCTYDCAGFDPIIAESGYMDIG